MGTKIMKNFIFLVFYMAIFLSLAEGSERITEQTKVKILTQTAALTHEQTKTYGEGYFSGTASSEPMSGVSTPLSEEKIIEGVKISQEKISLDLKGIDIVELFRILSLKMNLTIVPTRSVTGRVNVFLNSLTFDDALDVILVSQDLACVKKGNIITIMTAAEYERFYGKKYNETRKFKTIKLNYAKPAAVFNALTQIKSDIGKIISDETSGTIILIDTPDKLKFMEETIEDLDRPLITAIIELQYAKPEDIKSQISNAITPGLGEVIVDKASNKVVVSDLPSKISKIKRMIRSMDEESQQVFIDVEIIQISVNNKFQRGIDWEKIYTNPKLHSLDLIGKFPVSPDISAYQKIVYGALAEDEYTATLQFLQRYGDVKTMSRPRIAVINNQEAKIMVGSREAYVTQTISQAETTTVTSENVAFIDVGVKLNVVPTVHKDGYISLKIKPEVSAVTDTLTTAIGSTVPIVTTSEVETVAKVKDGVMIMVAGFTQHEKKNTVSGLPIVSKAPFVGTLFGTRTQEEPVTKELIVFLTPHLIKGDTTAIDTGLERYIPNAIMPEDIKDAIVLKELENIEIKQEKERKDLSEVNIQERTKGMKHYQ
jgi:type II secretory pathway component GspD/PulD (secretin)